MLQPTFGYLLGFALQAWFCGKYARRLRTISFRSLLAVNAGRMAIVYILGIGWFYLMSNYVLQAPIAFWAAIFYCGILQAGPDFLLCMAAAGLALRCYKAGLWLAMPTAAGREQVEVKEADHGQSIIHHGTGTDIGKTYVTGLIVKKLREAGLDGGYYKAALSGAIPDEAGHLLPGDALYVNDTARLGEKMEDLVTYVYREAVSPHLAAKINHLPIDFDRVKADFARARHDTVI